MGSMFTVRLVGDDDEHLAAVAEAALDEIERVERLLSWRDPRSECSRIHREAATGPVLVDFEMAAILQTCDEARRATEGYFDVVASSESDISNLKLQIDAVHRLVHFTDPRVRLDFGAFGKGYALDRAADELRRFGATRALLDGGTSSVLALGAGPDGSPWRVGLRNPFDADGRELRQLRLTDAALSCSGVFDGAAATSDVVDPHTGRPLTDAAACAVVANSAATAEILSTALLCMGKERATAYIETTANAWLDATSAVVWIESGEQGASVKLLLDRKPGIFA
jgi:thiamine biosynthesis lipoprotein